MQLRLARHTERLQEVVAFYRDGVGLTEIGGFRDHAGYDGVLLSNGPGDPEPLATEVETVRALLGTVPILGICLGHQLLALATGHETFKLPFGHRGGQRRSFCMLSDRRAFL
jgi:carbamoylphosphate synthase small subunit